MRKVAEVRTEGDIRRVILHETAAGVYLFPCAGREDGSSTGDFWFPNVEQAETACRAEYGIEAGDWVEIPDPLPGCLQDWIAPVRFKQYDSGHPQWEVIERLEDGQWRELAPPAPQS